MEHPLTSTMRCCLNKQVSLFPCKRRDVDLENIRTFQYNLAFIKTGTGSQRFCHPHLVYKRKRFMSHMLWRTFSLPIGLEDNSSSLRSEDCFSDDEYVSTDSLEDVAPPLTDDELKFLLADSERAKLIKKLSEANQQNRFLKRQLLVNEDVLMNFKSELAVMELEMQALVSLADEVAKSITSEGLRKINGKYIQSHLLSCLETVHEKLKEQVKGVEAAQSKEVPVLWYGMAENVQVMGTFDGWIQGEHLSPEYAGSFTKFSTKLMLRPGRYEIKFLVDGEWQLSPDFPTVGEGLMKNNLLIVE